MQTACRSLPPALRPCPRAELNRPRGGDRSHRSGEDTGSRDRVSVPDGSWLGSGQERPRPRGLPFCSKWTREAAQDVAWT